MAAKQFTKVCAHCGGEFQTERLNRIRFCSLQCGWAQRKIPIAQRFTSKLSAPDESGCSLWLGGIGSAGYGVFWAFDRQVRAHRFAWELENGPVPKGLFVCHRCDNPRCCSVAHLFLGTAQENTNDMMRKNRHKTTIGTAVRNSKLTDEMALAIRRSSLKNGELAKMYGISPSGVTNIKQGRSWVHVGS